MELANLKMPPFNTTLMGVLRGVADYFGIGITDPMLYGGTGHAFLMNIHRQLCPSGPYCWNPTAFYSVMANIGIEVDQLGFFSLESPAEERKALEATIVRNLDEGIPCSLLNMENQLVTGYDETGLITAQPWPGCDFPQKHLTFGSWAEFGDGCHASFFAFHKVEPADETKTMLDSLRYAINLYEHPLEHSGGDYSVGAGAYANWIQAVRDGHGSEHGSWWNAMVWSECRSMAAAYLAEIAEKRPAIAPAARDLSAGYARIAEALNKAGDKEMDSEEKILILEQAAAEEAKCIRRLEAIV